MAAALRRGAVALSRAPTTTALATNCVWRRGAATSSSSGATQLHVVLWRPGIAGNLGAALRTARGFGAQLHVIEPGVDVSARAAARAAVGYTRARAGDEDAAAVASEAHLYASLVDYLARAAPRMDATCIVSKAAKYGRCDLHEWTPPAVRHLALLFGNESTGVDALFPALAEAAQCAHLRHAADGLSTAPTLAIPMAPGLRSHNLAVSVGIVMWEASRARLLQHRQQLV